MFGHMLTLKTFFGSNAALNVCFVAQIFFYRQRSEQIGKWASNAADMSPTSGIICWYGRPYVGDMLAALDTCLPICSLC